MRRQRLFHPDALTAPMVFAVQLVFLHGFPLDGRMWRDQLGLLPGAVRCPTLYRLGNSIEAWAAGVLECMEQLPAVVVGSSMGGSCALEMARQQGDLIEAIVLVGAKAGHRPEPALRDGYIDLLRRGGAAAMWARVGLDFFGPEADPHCFGLKQKRARGLADGPRAPDPSKRSTGFTEAASRRQRAALGSRVVLRRNPA